MRNIKIINENWLFSKDAKSAPASIPADWTALNLPFTWNGKDGQDGGNDYYRGTCYFVKELTEIADAENEINENGSDSNGTKLFKLKKIDERFMIYFVDKYGEEDELGELIIFPEIK